MHRIYDAWNWFWGSRVGLWTFYGLVIVAILGSCAVPDRFAR